MGGLIQTSQNCCFVFLFIFNGSNNHFSKFNILLKMSIYKCLDRNFGFLEVFIWDQRIFFFGFSVKRDQRCSSGNFRFHSTIMALMVYHLSILGSLIRKDWGDVCFCECLSFNEVSICHFVSHLVSLDPFLFICFARSVLI